MALPCRSQVKRVAYCGSCYDACKPCHTDLRHDQHEAQDEAQKSSGSLMTGQRGGCGPSLNASLMSNVLVNIVWSHELHPLAVQCMAPASTACRRATTLASLMSRSEHIQPVWLRQPQVAAGVDFPCQNKAWSSAQGQGRRTARSAACMGFSQILGDQHGAHREASQQNWGVRVHVAEACHCCLDIVRVHEAVGSGRLQLQPSTPSAQQGTCCTSQSYLFGRHALL